MVYVEGRPLAEVLEEGRVPVWRAARWAAALASALAESHRAGVVHGNVNPDTVIVGADDTITLRTVGAPPRLTYLAPEQLRGEPASAAADVFAFGAIAFVMFTGREAFPADSSAEALPRLDPQRASALQPELDAAIAALIDECLRKEPALRPTMKSVADRFGEIASSMALEAEKETEVRALVKRATMALQRRDVEEALAACKSLLALSPDSAEANELRREIEEIQSKRRAERASPPSVAPPAPRPPAAAPAPPRAAPAPAPPPPPPLAAPAPAPTIEPEPVPMPVPGSAVEQPSAPKRVDENVQFTVYRPDVIAPGKWHALVVFAHLASRRPDAPDDEPDPLEEVDRRAKQIFGPAATPGARTDSTAAIPEEGQLRIVPAVPGIEFNPPEYRFVWLESVHQADFRMRAHGMSVGTIARGRITVYLDVLPIAEMTIAVRVEASASERETKTREVINPYRRIFASYSHKDEAVVRQFEKYAAGMGDRYMRDVIELRAGEQWQPRLCEMIESADVFQLFWSTNSMASTFVRHEWEHALTLKKRDFIRPLYWEDPLPRHEGLPPPALEALHFAFVGERAATVAPGPAAPPSVSTRETLERERHLAMEQEHRREEAARAEAERAEQARRAAEMERARREAEVRQAAEERARREEQEERLRAQEEARRAEIDRMRREAEAMDMRRREEERHLAEQRAREDEARRTAEMDRARREAEARQAAVERAQQEAQARQTERARREEPGRDVGYGSGIPNRAPRTESAAPEPTMSPRLWPIVVLAAIAILLAIVALRSC